jgi:hypothetical protein
MEGYCSTGQSPQWAVVPMEELETDYLLFYLSLELSGWIKSVVV